MTNAIISGATPRCEFFIRRITDDELDVLNQFAIECKQAGTKPCVVTVLTSKTDSLAEYEYNVTTNEVVFSYVSLAIGCGVTDIVCSPKEAEFLRQATGWPEYMRLNTPGVRLASSSKDDQERVMTPGEALFKGADRLVIGRDPLSAAQRQAISAQARVSTIQNQLNLVNFQSNALEAQLAEFRQNNGFLKRRFGKSAGEFRTLQQDLKLLQAQRAELESQLSASGMPQDKLASSA